MINGTIFSFFFRAAYFHAAHSLLLMVRHQNLSAFDRKFMIFSLLFHPIRRKAPPSSLRKTFFTRKIGRGWRNTIYLLIICHCPCTHKRHKHQWALNVHEHESHVFWCKGRTEKRLKLFSIYQKSYGIPLTFSVSARADAVALAK